MNNLDISNTSLFFASSLVLIALVIDYKEKLGLGKDIFIAAIRAVIQLFIIGYVLSAIFKLDNVITTTVMVLFIIFNAAYNAGKRANHLKNSFQISLIAIGVGTFVSLTVLYLSGTLKWTPSQIVPITGMIASNAMTAIGVGYRTMQSKFTDQKQQVQEKLALGATKKQATLPIIRESIKTAMSPSIDSTKTVGLVSLPGMMSGLMFAGIDPTTAIRYQIVVMFMLISTTGFATMIATYLSYGKYFNDFDQLN
ncbi:ABC transporter permease [Vagococcus carniphilus]|uniref:ABC transporter permease n=1 Tax=Vagococcus carniphilus TaxID=218144 RepID=UPI0028903311|nr:iron export ABC transporter permease subunit FetB [Vagococcus carniphilus]MDT2815820.1 iron export ABC transporter permease subunit FetB [Vagococcus carniphilus]MDT2831072.1 iron export ABC transporter permease subunit FetB [Vagococcus carniphilus]MDT2853808.1 iron export ABC transporter permease subunit FetB [Vagococcus carniphilus]MDT2866185.1 iron export ABC transporter permease subunit FetB [Vagococcus carniphilus]